MIRSIKTNYTRVTFHTKAHGKNKFTIAHGRKRLLVSMSHNQPTKGRKYVRHTVFAYLTPTQAKRLATLLTKKRR